ncbi:MAG: hypothetical protein R2733_20365 [Acidimicrobiales bacterium]
MRSVPWITLYVGIFIAGGYVLGSVVRWRLWSAPSLRPAARLDLDRPLDDDAGRLDPGVIMAAIETVAAVGWSLFVLWVTDRLAPGTTTFRDSSAVGFLASQSLTAWESASLWSGLAVVVGIAFPPPVRVDRGRSGVAPTAGLLLFHLPIALFVAAGAFFGAQLVRGRQRWSHTVALLALPVAEWTASMLQVRSVWGFVHGPETALWMVGVAGVLAARRGRSTWQQNESIGLP